VTEKSVYRGRRGQRRFLGAALAAPLRAVRRQRPGAHRVPPLRRYHARRPANHAWELGFVAVAELTAIGHEIAHTATGGRLAANGIPSDDAWAKTNLKQYRALYQPAGYSHAVRDMAIPTWCTARWSASSCGFTKRPLMRGRATALTWHTSEHDRIRTQRCIALLWEVCLGGLDCTALQRNPANARAFTGWVQNREHGKTASNRNQLNI